MKFVCDRCQTKYSIADEKVRQKILKIRCKTCENVITVREPPAEGASASPSTGGAVPVPALGAPPRAAEWHFAVGGKEEGPFELGAVAKKLSALRPDEDAHVWKAGFDGWKLAKDVPAVRAEVARLVGSRTPPPPPPSGTPKAVGAASAASMPLAAVGRARATGTSMPAVGAQAASKPLPLSAFMQPAATGAASMPGESHGFDDEDRTQISPLDASMLADEPMKAAVAAKASAATARASAATAKASAATVSKASKPASSSMASTGLGTPKGGRPSGARDVAGPATDGSSALARSPFDLPFTAPPQLEPVVAKAPARASAPSMAATQAAPLPIATVAAVPPQTADLSKLVGLPGFFGRHKGLKYVALGGILVGLGGAVVALGLAKKEPPTAAAVSDLLTKPAAPPALVMDENEAREQAARRFGPTETSPPESEAARVAAVSRAGRPDPRRPDRDRDRERDNKKATKAAPPSVTPPAVAAVAPPPLGSSAAPAVPQERRVGPAPRAATQMATRGATMGQGDIMAVITRNRGMLKSCYERALRRDDRLRTGKLDVDVTVGGSGSVTKVACKAPPELSTVSGCIERAVKGMRFPASGEEYNVTIPVVLTGSS